MPTMEERLKKLQSQIEKRKLIETERKNIAESKKRLAKLRGKDGK